MFVLLQIQQRTTSSIDRPSYFLIKVLFKIFQSIVGPYKKPEEKTKWELHKDVACCIEEILEAALHKTAPYKTILHKTAVVLL